MTFLELLAPARNTDIGIAAIDCGADAVYIGGPDFGARKAAGNSIGDISRLCDYAHKVGARVFVTVNNLVFPEEREDVHRMMLEAQKAGADAFIVRDTAICEWDDIVVPLHASTQCAIRTADKARLYESLGFSRLVLERQLSLKQIKEIRKDVSCELEFFVHGALCVGYSGECFLSEYINGRSANRGDCMQACRSLYDLIDENGRTLIQNKALLSLKDYKLKNRIPDLADAGIISFKIEGRLKNESYVKNVVREYSMAIDAFIAGQKGKFGRSSFGKAEGGFTPDVNKTFNRGYTELFLNEVKDKWSSMDAPKSMGEFVGIVHGLRRADRYIDEFTIIPSRKGLALSNGDGFSFVRESGISGFRADICHGLTVRCKHIPELADGVEIYRNINQSFEKELGTKPCKRYLEVNVSIHRYDDGRWCAAAKSDDGRYVTCDIPTSGTMAENRDRMVAVFQEQISKKTGHYSFTLTGIDDNSEADPLPFLPAAVINGVRRRMAEELDNSPCIIRPMLNCRERNVHLRREWKGEGFPTAIERKELMRSKYCIRQELGICLKSAGKKVGTGLSLENNGKVFPLGFDCKNCEMTVLNPDLVNESQR